MLFTFLLVVQAIVAAALVTVILMQRSEGGGLGMGGSPSGLMSARGAADFLTRATTVLATIFVSLSIILAVIAATQHRGATIDSSLVDKQSGAPLGDTTAPGAGADGLSGAAAAAASNSGAAPAAGNQSVPLAQ
jgi:preprotein translocase subunit SecG